MERYIRRVFYYETDKMAIVHNANYLRIFEESRLDFMVKAGVPYTYIESAGVLIPQTEAHVEYKHTLIYGDEFAVKVELIYFNGVRMTLDYEIKRLPDEKLIATGRTSHCFVDEKTRVPFNLKKKMPEESNLILKLIKE